MDESKTKDNVTKVFFGFYDVFPVQKGSTIRTRNLLGRLPNTEITLFSKMKDQLPPHEKIGPFDVHRIKCETTSPFQQSEEFTLKLAEFLKERDQKKANDFDIWHCRSPFDGILASHEAELRGEPMIFEVNGLPSIEWAYHYPKIMKKNKRGMKKIAEMEMLTAMTATHLTTPSAVTKNYLTSKGIDKDKITIIPNGANSNKFKPMELSFEEKKKLLTLPEGWEKKKIIGYIGAFQPWQGIHTLIESLTRLKSISEDIGVVLMGKSKSLWRHTLRKIAKKNEVREMIHFSHPKAYSLMPKVLNCFDLAVAPLTDSPRNTVQGCNPIKLFEYSSSGLPIVVSDLPVTREILTDDNCRFVTPDNPIELGEALKELLEHPEEREKLGKKARNSFFEDKNDWKYRSKKLNKVYSKLI
ncbi:MAG: glycosyltransferase [Candidatus Heimdallarchaeota archaeon]|nr:glycosyltransferase [Candidatus Heimdallarchaeota archaeon]MCK5049789.1 glycosyltransferase [Candidatus Heimdallarchaeota archaeon]